MFGSLPLAFGNVTNDEGLIGISEEVGKRVAYRRKHELRLSVEELAQRCTEIGASSLTVNAIYVIESGRREKDTGRRRRLITVDEFMALAVALEMHPVDLLVSADRNDGDPYRVTPGVEVSAARARRWIAGRGHLRDEPSDLLDVARLIALMPKSRADEIYGEDWLSQFDHDPRAYAVLAEALRAGAAEAYRTITERGGESGSTEDPADPGR
ncbi:hypothetical protein GCM10023175_67480 [Pseudonocardia xishanensis]|uniref:Helix-turn-helix protein n=2 Tax=Pseudonocardia xishanensis TaxID=630995 RepID=A0ABP8S3C1_9PSEU